MNSFIKNLMEEKKIKQKDLAQILGISSPAVSQWNDEGTNIDANHLFMLSKLFHVTVDEILAGKRSGESLEDKWAREYNVNEDAAKKALLDGEKEKVLNYFEALAKVNFRFFNLFEKKILGNISANELKEWNYLRQYYEIKAGKSNMLDGNQISRKTGDVDQKIISILKGKIGPQNTDSIIWELRKIYNITHYGVEITKDREIVFVDDCYNEFDNPLEYLKNDEDVFFAIYKSLSQIEKDLFLTSEFHNKKNSKYLYELIKRGGKIVYLPSDLNLTNFDMKDLGELEGEKVSVPELDKAQSVVYEVYDFYYQATYKQYQALINRSRMQQIEMETKYKEREPIKYWEYIKNINVLI